MSELERRLRDAARSESAAYEPSADLPARIGQRVRSRRRRAQTLAGGGVLTIVVLIAMVVTQLPDDDDRQGVVANDPSSTTSSTTSTTTSTTTTSTTVPTTDTSAPPPPVIDANTPLGPKGVGPIEAGMTIAEARSVSGMTITLIGSTEEFGGCYYVDLEGQPDLSIRVNAPAGRPEADISEGVIRVVVIYALDPDGPSTRLTTGGVGLGASEAEVRAAHDNAVQELPHDYVPEGAYLYVFPPDTPGFGFRYVLDENRVVTSIDVGDAGGITAPEGCV
jgi:hypothetical protein